MALMTLWIQYKFNEPNEVLVTKVAGAHPTTVFIENNIFCSYIFSRKFVNGLCMVLKLVS